MRCVAVIVAAGRSRRMGFDKLAAPLDGVPVLRRSVERLMEVPEIGRVVAVCDAERFDTLLSGTFAKPLDRVDGGRERQDSVFAGLEVLGADDDLVAVHDGARPLVHPADVSAVIAVAAEHGAATLARAVADTLKRADDDGCISESVDREALWAMETPQVFGTQRLLAAYEAIRRDGRRVTDEVSALQAAGDPVRIVASTRPNPKITVPADLELAGALLD